MAVAGFVVAVGVSLAVCGLGILLGPRLGVVDHPDGGLKPHDRPIAPLGGIGVMAGLHVGLAVAGSFDLALFFATVLAWILGFADDVFGLSPRSRLAGVGLAGLLLVAGSDVDLFSLVALFWVAAVLVVVNATNLFDGLDGLAGSVSVVAMAGMWILTLMRPDMGAPVFLVAIGATLGFLGWNWPPARIFLGDNGAYTVGITLVWLAMQASPEAGGAVLAAAIIGVPLLDLTATVARRLRSGDELTSGGRDHVYDRLRGIGLSTAAVVGAMAAAQLAWAVILLSVAALWSDTTAVVTGIVLGSVLVVLFSRYPEPASARSD